jgi:hypothetical protein
MRELGNGNKRLRTDTPFYGVTLGICKRMYTHPTHTRPLNHILSGDVPVPGLVCFIHMNNGTACRNIAISRYINVTCNAVGHYDNPNGTNNTPDRRKYSEMRMVVGGEKGLMVCQTFIRIHW